MLIQQIAHGLMKAHLTPGDCMLLATACREAERHIVGPEHEAEAAHIETLGAAFRAAAVGWMGDW